MNLRLQFLLPVGIVLLGTLAGWRLEYAILGFVLSGLIGIAIATLFAERAIRRLSDVASILLADPDEHEPEPSTARAADEIDTTRANIFRALEVQKERFDREHEESNRRIRLLDRLSDGVMLVSLNGEVVYANVAAASLVGGRNPIGRSFIATIRDHELSDALFDCLRTGREHRHSLEPLGGSRVIDAIFARISSAPPEVLVLMRDVTELTRLQTLRRDFVANVSHELRTPLSTIKILTETLIELNHGRSDESRFLKKIDAEVDSMTELVGDLMQLTQLESGRTPLTYTTVHSSEMLSEVRGRLIPIADRQRVHLRIDEQAGGFEFTG